MKLAHTKVSLNTKVYRVAAGLLPAFTAACSQRLGTLDQPRTYQLNRQSAALTDRQVEIEFLDAGAPLFSFTFG